MSAVPPVMPRFIGDELSGPGIVHSRKTIGELRGVFADEVARADLPPGRLAYEVKCHFPVADGTAGGLFFGVSYIQPGDVAGECFMTRGHFHRLIDRGEYYWGIAGEGVLLLMDVGGRTWHERVCPGSLHYIPGHTAHRLVNTGAVTLAVGACWPSDAGHDYEAIERLGFGLQVYRSAEGGVEMRKVRP